MKIFTWLMSKPIVLLCIVIAIGYGIIKFQVWRIDNLKDEKEALENTLTVEREHTEKVVTAFEDKGEKDHDRKEFTRRAAAALEGKRSKETLSPILLDAYQRVHKRLSDRIAAGS